MTLEQQIKTLVEEAAHHDVPPMVVQRAIAPVLRSVGQQLQHLQYHILQNLHGDWVLTTLVNPRTQETKSVIYAFVTAQDAATFQGSDNLEHLAMPIDSIQLLFRLFSLEQVTSIIFLENSVDLQRGREIRRQVIVNQIQEQLQQFRRNPPHLA